MCAPHGHGKIDQNTNKINSHHSRATAQVPIPISAKTVSVQLKEAKDQIRAIKYNIKMTRHLE